MGPKPVINAKKAKLYNSRVIKTQNHEPSLIGQDKLNVPQFVEAREFEIKSFELSQLRSKFAASNRAFQSLPRTLRRRAASHNVKRIPKRLRAKALREMKTSSNGTPPKKEHLRGRKLYRLRMTKKLLKWASRIKLLREPPSNSALEAKMNMRGRIKALNLQIKELTEHRPGKPHYNNVVGSYDNTGLNILAQKPQGNIKFHKRQNRFVWLPTHVWHAKRFHMVSQYGFKIPLSPTQKCFKAVNRALKHATVACDTSYMGTMILELTSDRVFTQLLLEITRYQLHVPLKILNGQKSYNDWIYQGLEAEGGKEKIGKAMIYANLAHKRITIRLFPSIYDDFFAYLQKRAHDLDTEASLQDCRYSMGSIDLMGPTSLNLLSKSMHIFEDQGDAKIMWSQMANVNDSNTIPVGTVLSFDIRDPRLWKHPVNMPIIPHLMFGCDFTDLLLHINQNGDSLVNQESQNKLFAVAGRAQSYENQHSIKEIGKKFSRLSPCAKSLASQDLHSLRVPVFITKISQSKWTVLLPWYWVLPLWIKLVASRNIKSGGLRQLKQAQYENNQPSYPTDFPFLKDGYAYNIELGKANSDRFDKVPKHHSNQKRPDFANSTIVSPFNCDWRGLRDLTFLKKLHNIKQAPKDGSSTSLIATFSKLALERDVNSYGDLEPWLQCARETAEYHKKDSLDIPIELYDPRSPAHATFVDDTYEISSRKEAFSNKLCVIQVSLKLIHGGHVKDCARIYESKTSVPDLEFKASFMDVIGFVTSGAYNLNVGQSTAIGLMSAAILRNPLKYVYIRNVGCTTYHLASYVEL